MSPSSLVMPWLDSPGKATMVAVLTEPVGSDYGWLGELDSIVDGLEIRADLVGDIDPERLRRHFSGMLIYNLRSADAGGGFTGPLQERRYRLLAASRDYDVVDLEWPHDLMPATLASLPSPRRRISRHSDVADVAGLTSQFDEMTSTAAGLYLLSTASADGALPAMLLLRTLGRKDVTAYATGPGGAWSRILAPWLGAPVVFGQAASSGSAAEMPSVHQLTMDYGLPALPKLRELYGIVGKSVSRSLSPRLHNAAYRELGAAALYLPFQNHGMADFWRELAISGFDELGLPLRGMTVTGTHKREVVQLGTETSPLARRIEAANILCRDGERWRADTTDAAGVVDALTTAGIDPADREVAVVGCGGAGLAAVAALQAAGAEVTVVNRSEDNGRRAARIFSTRFVRLSEFSSSAYSLIVHATPVTSQTPFSIAELDDDAVVLEFVYAPTPTPLMAAARARRLTTIDGWDILDVEVRHQFRLMTGLDMPTRPASTLARMSTSTEDGLPPKLNRGAATRQHATEATWQ